MDDHRLSESGSTNPMVSIIVLNYNGAKFINQMIGQILNFEYSNFECIVVDNCSTDGSLELLRQHNDIRLIENISNHGTSKGRNIGARAARGEYLFFLDNDVLAIDHGILGQLIFLANSLRHSAFINVLLIDEENLDTKKTIYYGGYYGRFGICKNKPMSYDQLRGATWIETANSFTGALFVSSEVWRTLGGFDESQPFNIDDDEISLRAKIFGYSNYTYTGSYFVHLGKIRRIHNSTYRWKFRYYFSGKVSPIIKYFELKNVLTIIPFFFINTALKTIINVIYRRDLLLFWAFIQSIALSFYQLTSTLKQRRVYQNLRRVPDSTIFRLRLIYKRE